MRKLSIVAAAMFAATTFASTINLSTVTEDTEFTNGDVVTGTLLLGAGGQFPKLTIADGASVTLRDAVVNVRGLSGSSFAWPAIACNGNATIVLEGENTVNPTFHVRVQKGRISWETGRRSSLHFCFLRCGVA